MNDIPSQIFIILSKDNIFILDCRTLFSMRQNFAPPEPRKLKYDPDRVRIKPGCVIKCTLEETSLFPKEEILFCQDLVYNGIKRTYLHLLTQMERYMQRLDLPIDKKTYLKNEFDRIGIFKLDEHQPMPVAVYQGFQCYEDDDSGKSRLCPWYGVDLEPITGFTPYHHAYSGPIGKDTVFATRALLDNLKDGYGIEPRKKVYLSPIVPIMNRI